MAVYIVDASVVVEYLITGPYTVNARVLFTQVTDEDRLIVPEFCLLECTNVLWKHVRFQGMLESQAEKLLSHLRKLPLKRVPVKAVLASALEIGLTHQLAIYDAAYIALARRSNHPLITVDQVQQKVGVSAGVVLTPITDFAP